MLKGENFLMKVIRLLFEKAIQSCYDVKVNASNTCGKAIAPEHYRLNFNDHLKLELNHYYIVLNDKDDLTY